MKELITEKIPLCELENSVKQLLIKEGVSDDYRGFTQFILKLEKTDNLFYRINRFVGYRDGEREYVFRHGLCEFYNRKLPNWVNVLLYLIICNIDYSDVYAEETTVADSIFNPRYTELLDYISNLMTTNNVNHTHLLFETHTTYIGAYVNENFPIIKKIVDTYSNSKCTDILNSKLTVLMTICFTNSPIKCLLKNEKGFYINSLYINIDGKTYVDKIHLNVVNEDFDEGIQFIAIREITDNEQCIKQRLELKGKNINIDYTIPFYDQLILPNNI